MKSERYYEAHITCNSETLSAGEINERAWELFTEIAQESDWKASRFDQDDVDGYHDKWFMSARDEDLEVMKKRIKDVMWQLYVDDFVIVRWKIEDTILDSKLGDKLE
jgi:hypothetical protein